MRGLIPKFAALAMTGLAIGCADDGVPPSSDPYAQAAEAASAIAWSPALERQVAALLISQPIDRAALDAVLAPNRTALNQLSIAAKEPGWTLPPPDGERPSRDDWEAAAWLAYGEALSHTEDPWPLGLTAARLGHRLAHAEGGTLSDLVIAFGLSEAGYLQAQRLASVTGAGADDADDAMAPLSPDAWTATLRREAAAAQERIRAMADDPMKGLGFAAEEVPPAERSKPAGILFNEETVQEAAAAAFLALMGRGPDDCIAPPAMPPVPGPPVGGGNMAGRLFLRDLTAALVQIDDRRCLTEAARRATLLAWRLHDAPDLPSSLPDDTGLLDPFTGRPFAYDPAKGTIHSAGRDRELSADGGPGPFDDTEPTWFLDTRPLL